MRAARGGQEALDRLASPERDEIDLVLLDVMMPDLNGFTVLKRLRAAPRTERLIVIMLTGRDAPTEKTHGLQLGADDYIAKPFDANELLARVNSMLRLHRAEQNLWMRNQALAALNAVAQTIGRAVELPDVLNSALDQVLASLDLIAGLITLRAPGGRQVIAAQRWPTTEVARDLNVAEQVAQAGQAQWYVRTPPAKTDAHRYLTGVWRGLCAVDQPQSRVGHVDRGGPAAGRPRRVELADVDRQPDRGGGRAGQAVSRRAAAQ